MAIDKFASKEKQAQQQTNEELIQNVFGLAPKTSISVPGGLNISVNDIKTADNMVITIIKATNGDKSLTFIKPEYGSEVMHVVQILGTEIKILRDFKQEDSDFLNGVLNLAMKKELNTKIKEQNEQTNIDGAQVKDNISNATAWIQKNQPEVFGQASNSPGKEFTIQGPNGTIIGISLNNTKSNSSGQPDYAIRINKKGKDYYGTYDPITGATTIAWVSAVTGRGTALVKEDTDSDWYLIDENGRREISNKLQKDLQNYYISTVQNMAKIEEIIKVASATPSLTNKAIALTSTSSKTEMEKLSESKGAEKIIEEKRDFEARALAASVAYESAERERKRLDEQKELEEILLNKNERRIVAMLPELIDHSFTSREDRSLIRTAFEEGKLVLNEGRIIIMKGFKGPVAEVKAFGRQVGMEWENLEKKAVMEVAADKDIEKKVEAIQTNIVFKLTKPQREMMATKMDAFLRNINKQGETHGTA